MKHHRQIKAIGIVALASSTIIGIDAHAQDAGTGAQIDALKAQIGQLLQQVNELSARQEATARKQEALEAAAPAARTATAASDNAARGITARFGGVDARLFGSFDAYVENQRTGAGTVNRVAASGSGYAQLGFDATKDVGNGTKVFGDVRLSYQPDNGVTNSTVRTFNTAWLGMSNDRFGTFRLGRQGTQLGEALSTFRLIRLGTGNFIYNPGSTLTQSNMVKYISPRWGNVDFMTSVAFGETVGSNTNGLGTAGMVRYDDGKITAFGGLMQSRAPLDITPDGDGIRALSLGAGYNFGFMKPFVVMQNVSSRKDPQVVDQRGLYYGIDFPVGPGTLRVEGESISNKAWQNSDARSLNVRYDWQFAPNTIIYFSATKIYNGSKVYYPIVGKGGFAAVSRVNANALNPSFNTSLNGTDPSSLAVGVKFDF